MKGGDTKSTLAVSHLRTLAEKATKGPREARRGNCVVEWGFADRGEGDVFGQADVYGFHSEANAAYIAALSPDTVLALLDVMDAAREAWQANHDVAPDVNHAGGCEHHDSLNPHWAGWERLRAALARLEAVK